LLPQADLASEIDALRDEVRSEKDRTLRALADLRNYRRHAERDGQKFTDHGKSEIMLPLLDIVDDLENALKNPTDTDDSVAKGVRLIYRKCLALLAANGVLPFESVGAAFDPKLHEAVALTVRDDLQSGTVVDEARRGYTLRGALFRAAQVRVAE
jgi:molecular chaperone GrpE